MTYQPVGRDGLTREQRRDKAVRYRESIVSSLEAEGLRAPERADGYVAQWLGPAPGVVVTLRAGIDGSAEWDARWPDETTEQGYNGTYASQRVDYVPWAARDIGRVLEDTDAIYCLGRDYVDAAQAREVAKRHRERQERVRQLLSTTNH